MKAAAGQVRCANFQFSSRDILIFTAFSLDGERASVHLPFARRQKSGNDRFGLSAPLLALSTLSRVPRVCQFSVSTPATAVAPVFMK